MVKTNWTIFSETHSDQLTKFQIRVYNENESNQKHEEKVKRNIKLGLIDMESVIKSELLKCMISNYFHYKLTINKNNY